jgi:predicted ribosome quality control (RQC) complex YloA/Tae2 family protein
MELSGIELRYVINEIKSRIVKGYYLSGINAITKTALLFRLHHPTEPDVMLVVSTRGFWITKLMFKQLEDNDLTNTLKTELERSKIESLNQLASERVAIMTFRHMDGENRTLIGEFFGQGNIILCDEKMRILAILNPIEVRHRTLKVGFQYVNPPSRGIDVFDLSVQDLVSMRRTAEKDLDILRWIGRNVSLPKKFVEETVARTGIDNKKAAQLSDDDLEKIHAEIKKLVNDITKAENQFPVLIMGPNEKAEEALPILTHEASKLITKKAGSYMEAVDEVLSQDILNRGKNLKTVELDKQIATLQHDLEEQTKAKEEVVSKSACIRKIANQLMAMSYQGIHTFDDKSIRELLSANSASVIDEKGRKFLEVADERIQIEDGGNLPKVASLFFSRAKEMERGSMSIEEAKATLLSQIDKLRNRTAIIHNKIVIKKHVNKEWYERYRWFITSDGLLAIGGRDSSSNSSLIRKHLTENDIVFHAEVHGSPFFVLKKVPKPNDIDKSLQEVAQATVCFSRAWKDGLFSADAYWVMADQIKKGAPTGQFLPKGSFVIEGKRNYIKGLEIRLAIGIIRMDKSSYSLVCGPADAIKKRALTYSILLPGGSDPMGVAKKIKTEFIKISSDNSALLDYIKSLSLDDLVRTIPNGQSKISFTERGELKGLEELEATLTSHEQSN